MLFLYRIFFPKQIASYLKKSETELHHARELAKSLSGVMPGFESLMTEVIAGTTSPNSG